MTYQNKIKILTLSVIAVKAVAMAIFALATITLFSQNDIYSASIDLSSQLMFAAVFPIGVSVFSLYSLKLYSQGSHYGWMGLIMTGIMSLASWSFPFAVALIYFLCLPAARNPMIAKLAEEWDLNENTTPASKSEQN